jgi:hypothetical protein
MAEWNVDRRYMFSVYAGVDSGVRYLCEAALGMRLVARMTDRRTWLSHCHATVA